MPLIFFKIKGVSSNKGHIRVGIFNNSQSWLDENKVFHSVIVTTEYIDISENYTPILTFSIKLTSGQYAVAAYHDINDNQKLDKNFLGIPIEPFGFSNNPTIIGKPSFKQCCFQVTDNKEVNIDIVLKKII